MKPRHAAGILASFFAVVAAYLAGVIPLFGAAVVHELDTAIAFTVAHAAAMSAWLHRQSEDTHQRFKWGLLAVAFLFVMVGVLVKIWSTLTTVFLVMLVVIPLVWLLAHWMVPRGTHA